VHLKRLAIVYNPKGGSASIKRVNELAGCFTTAGVQVDFKPTEARPGSARELTRAAVDAGVDLVVAFGGDGTAEQVAEGVTGTTVPMAIYPGGTGNLFARSFYSHPTPERFARMVMNGTPQPVDMIRADYNDLEGKAHSQLFLVGFGLGKLSDAISGASPVYKRIFGRLVYVLRVALACLWPSSRRFELSSPSNQLSVTAAAVFVLNVVPPAMTAISRGCSASDGLMDVVVFEARHAWQLIGVALCLAFSRPEESRCYRRFRAKELTIRCNKPRLPNIDGDPGVKTREIKLAVVPQAVQMVLS
jgi:diacylglycerol kinase family enzyme